LSIFLGRCQIPGKGYNLPHKSLPFPPRENTKKLFSFHLLPFRLNSPSQALCKSSTLAFQHQGTKGQQYFKFASLFSMRGSIDADEKNAFLEAQAGKLNGWRRETNIKNNIITLYF
jgi:hypothetical protein